MKKRSTALNFKFRIESIAKELNLDFRVSFSAFHRYCVARGKTGAPEILKSAQRIAVESGVPIDYISGILGSAERAIEALEAGMIKSEQNSKTGVYLTKPLLKL